MDKKVNQCTFKLHWLLDVCAGLSKRIDGVVNTIAVNQVLVPVKFIESYPPGALLGLVTLKWLVDRVGELLPEVFIAVKCYTLTQTISNIASMLATTAALLQLVTVILYTNKDDFKHYVQMTIHFYHAIYSQFREELVMIARLPGPQCQDSSVQQCATFELHEILRLALCQAKINGLKLLNGECFAGLEDTLNDKWLPLLYFFPHCVASAYCFPMNLFHLVSHEIDQTTLLINWYNSFGQKFTLLLLYQAPLFVRPLYPDPAFPPLWQSQISNKKGKECLSVALMLPRHFWVGLEGHCYSAGITTTGISWNLALWWLWQQPKTLVKIYSMPLIRFTSRLSVWDCNTTRSVF